VGFVKGNKKWLPAGLSAKLLQILTDRFLRYFQLRRLYDVEGKVNIKTTNDELERMWKEAIEAYFKVSFQDLPGGT
jgi:hypothetical protein